MNVDDSRPVVWIRDLFQQASAESMIRWMLVAWLVLVAVMVILDRVGGGLLGRSKPMIQVPPPRARAWRWGKALPPTDFSPLPSGTVIRETVQQRPRSIPLARPLELGPGPFEEVEPDPFDRELDDEELWLWLAEEPEPIYGAENVPRLEMARAPERLNPVSGRVEELDRDDTGRCRWPAVDTDRTTIGSFGPSADDDPAT